MSKNILSKIEESKKVSDLRSDKVVVIIGNVFSKIYGNPGMAILDKIDNKLSYYFEGAHFTPAYRNGIWDGIIRLFNWTLKSFPTGFSEEVIKILTKNDIEVKIKDIRKQYSIKDETIAKAFKSKAGFIPRPYQKKAVIQSLKQMVGIINIPTGGGKTAIINLIIKAIDLHTEESAKILLITGGITLLSQLRDEMQKFQKKDIGFIGEGIWDEQRITVASINTISRFMIHPERLRKSSKKKTAMQFLIEKEDKIEKKLKTEKLLSSTDVLFLDEAHHSPAKTFKEAIYKTNNASIRIGTTATYMRASNDNMMLHAVTGDIIFKRSLSWMIDQGYLAKPTVLLLPFDVNKDEEYENWREEYSGGISNNQKRSAVLAKVLSVFHRSNLNTVLFVREKNHGTDIYNMSIDLFKINEKEIMFLSGSDQQVIRKKALDAFTSGKMRSIVCTSILNEGVDFPEANAGIRASAEKYEGNIVQQIGRILRKVKNPLSKDIDRKRLQRVLWLDMCDMHTPTLAKHSLNRIKVYEKEKNFDIVYIKSPKDLKKIISERIKEIHVVRR